MEEAFLAGGDDVVIGPDEEDAEKEIDDTADAGDEERFRPEEELND